MKWRSTGTICVVLCGFGLLQWHSFATTPTGRHAERATIGGLVVTDPGVYTSQAEAVAIQPDGKVVIAGLGDEDFLLLRYTRSGQLDRGFGEGGVALADFEGGMDRAYAVAVQDSNKLVVAGTAWHRHGPDFGLIRYRQDGRLDTGFGPRDHLLTDFNGGSDGAFALFRTPAGGLLAVGGSYEPVRGSALALARYSQDGYLESSYGNRGKVLALVGSDIGVTAATLASDDKIVVVGMTLSEHRVVVARLTSAGELDRSFGDGGRIYADTGGLYAWPSALALQQDGKILVAGEICGISITECDFMVIRLLSDTGMDPSFAADGLFRLDLSDNYDTAKIVAVQPDGKSLIAGQAATNLVDFAVIRLQEDGALDPSFGSSGVTLTDFGESFDMAYAQALTSHGKIVLAGASDRFVALARYRRNGSLDPSFRGD